MKRQIFTVIAAMAAAACTSTEYVPVEELEPVLILNAQMTQPEDAHIIHLSTGSLSSVKPAEGTVSVSVNSGTPVILDTYTDQGTSNAWTFVRELAPGDEITVNASSGTLKATATTTVPSAPIVKSMEMQYDVPHADSGGFLDFDLGFYDEPVEDENAPYSRDAWHLLKINISDIPSEDNYYRVDFRLEAVMDIQDGNGPQKYVFNIWPDLSSEPVFTASSTTGGMLEGITESSSLFTDELFRDKDYTLKIYISERDIYHFRAPWTEVYLNEETGQLEETTLPEGTTYSADIIASLYSMNRAQYLYLKALGLDELSFLFSEPVSIPSNVEGGMGFVNVEYCKESRFKISE